jgi:hypothetical protein
VRRPGKDSERSTCGLIEITSNALTGGIGEDHQKLMKKLILNSVIKHRRNC